MTTTTRKIYFRINERGFANEYEILTVPAKGNECDKLIQALRDWDATTPNGSFDRIYRSELTSEDLRDAMPITDFEFRYRPDDSEIRDRQRDFERLVWGDFEEDDEDEDEYEYEHRDQCDF